MYGPPSDPWAKKVILMECDIPACSPAREKRIAGMAVSFCDVPFEASTRTPPSLSIETFPIPQLGFIVACQYIAVPVIDYVCVSKKKGQQNGKSSLWFND